MKRYYGWMRRGAMLGLSSIVLISGVRAEQKTPPNIIIILADDLGYGDVGCYGSKRFSTPAIDAIAKDGIRFTDFHSNGAVCSPTRAALLTGRYQQRSGVGGCSYGRETQAYGT